MNDVTILLPLPASRAAPVLGDLGFRGGAPLVDELWFDQLAIVRGDLGNKDLRGPAYTHHDFHLVAVRFDLCDHVAPGPCSDGADGMLWLVAQPIFDGTGSPSGSMGEPYALDVGVHLLYPIPAAELPGVIDELRALAALADRPDGPLAVASPTGAYLEQLRALVGRYATAANNRRMTANGQNAFSVGNAWRFRQFERTDDGYVPAVIPAARATEQDVLLQASDITWSSVEIADDPPGFGAILSGTRWATLDDRAGALDAAAAVENPTLHDTFDSQCLGCHVTTYMAPYRAGEASLDLASMPSWYHSRYDLTVPALPSPTRIRGLGYFGTEVVISQRVANETAHVLEQISARF